MLKYDSILIILIHLAYIDGNGFSMPLTEQLIKEMNYPYEVHTVQTTEGYVLTTYRIRSTENYTEHRDKLPPVVLMHGMGTSSDDFVLLGRDSLVFMMADAGYDVWLLNARYSESSVHVNISREDNAYWEYSWDDIAKHDLPESIDHVLETTGARKVIYIGYSYGNPSYVMMLNERPDLIDRMAVSVALSPSYFSTFFRPYAEVVDSLIKLGLFQNYFLGGKTYSEQKRTFELGKTKKASELKSAYAHLSIIMGSDLEQIDWNNSAKVLGRSAYVSLNQYAQIMQIFKDENLARFDFGYEGNIRKYGTSTAPSYSWKVLNAPMVLYFGKNDRILSLDIEKITSVLKRSGVKVYTRISTWKHFNHLDFLAGRTVAKELYQDILTVLRKILKRTNLI